MDNNLLLWIGVPLAIIIGIILAGLVCLFIYFMIEKVYFGYKRKQIPKQVLDKEPPKITKEVIEDDKRRVTEQRAFSELERIDSERANEPDDADNRKPKVAKSSTRKQPGIPAKPIAESEGAIRRDGVSDPEDDGDSGEIEFLE